MSNENITEEEGLQTEDIDQSGEEYAYLDRGGFSSEKFKIELRGLPKYYGIAELKKLMNQKLNLNTSKIKRPKNGSHWLYACFQNEEDRTQAIAKLNGYSWKGKVLVAEEAKPAPDPLVRKRKQEEDNPQSEKKKKEDDGKSQEERLMDATTPYHHLPYEEQLKLKEKEIKHLLMKFDNEIWKINKDKRSELEAKRKLFNGLSFDLKPIKKSPVTEGYRNKCEFTVGIDDESNLPTVGFRLGSYATGTVAVAPVHGLKHIAEEAKNAALLFQKFVRSSSMAPFSPADYSGYWRTLTVRNSKATGDVMLIIALHPQNLTEEELDKLKKDLIEHFSSEEAVACHIKSVYIELLVKKRVGEDGSKPTHLLGATHITDTIQGLHFRISPEAFFQINTAGADLLYQSAVHMSEVKADSTVVDICCGTGTIGLCFAKHCGQVLGLELIPEAVKDAKANAELNNITNCDFFTGKAEDILPSVLARATGSDVVAIVDPPRAGLHMRAVTQLRNTRSVSRLVYISCSPASAVKNFIDLARQASKTLRGPPFVPIRAVPVDMFPLTKHVELAVLFEREKKPRVSFAQRRVMLSFMMGRGGLARGRAPGAAGRCRSDMLGELAATMNKVTGGAVKTPEKWWKCWQDWKCDSKSKALRIQSYTGSGPSPAPLSQLEETLLQFCGVEVAQGQKGTSSSSETVDLTETQDTEYVDVVEAAEEDPLAPPSLSPPSLGPDSPDPTPEPQPRADRARPKRQKKNDRNRDALMDALNRRAAALERLPDSINNVAEALETGMQSIAAALCRIARAMEQQPTRNNV